MTVRDATPRASSGAEREKAQRIPTRHFEYLDYWLDRASGLLALSIVSLAGVASK
jgi:hypothetical protein